MKSQIVVMIGETYAANGRNRQPDLQRAVLLELEIRNFRMAALGPEPDW
ncbi:hypothetical protein M1D80_04720 (plasmid) [Phyllobacteriaceae bacterium JZ32]